MKNNIKYCIAILTPPVIGLVVGLIVFVSPLPMITIHRYEFLLNTIISTSATISGFILASVTILVGAPNSQIMKAIKKNGAHRELRWRYLESLILGLIQILFFTILGAVTDNVNSLPNWLIALSTGLLVSYICSVVSTCYYLLSIIGLINEPAPTVTQEPSTPPGKFRR